MYPCKETMKISASILKEWKAIQTALINIDHKSLAHTSGEVGYFRSLFPELENFLNSLRLSNNSIGFHCRHKEIHQKPIVKLHSGKSGCELGDYFLVVKYWNNGKLLGKKAMIYQFKYSRKQPTWSVDQRQLALLSDWPPFSFGRKSAGYNLFSIRPATPELGSYWLGKKSDPFSLYLTAHDVVCLQDKKNLKLAHVQESGRILGTTSLLSAIAWRLGEYIPPSSDMESFIEALYRYVDWAPDPPEEFKGFVANEKRGSFFALEINVQAEHKNI